MDERLLKRLRESAAKLKSTLAKDDGGALISGTIVADSATRNISMKDLVDKKKKQRQEDVEVREEVKKVSFSGEVGAHGWISPKGEFHQLGKDDGHHEWMKRQHKMEPLEAHENGWLSIGHAGEHNVQGHSQVLSNHRHPATQTARRLAGEHFDNQTVLYHSDKAGFFDALPREKTHSPEHRVRVNTQAWSKHGNAKNIELHPTLMFRSVEEKLEMLKDALGKTVKFNNWVHNTDEHIGQEYEWEYKNHTKQRHGDVFPTLDHFKHAVKNAEIKEVTPEFDKKIGNRSRTASVGQLKSLTSSYQHPRDVNRIVTGLKSNHPMPHPIVLRHGDGRHEVMSGNTRMDAAFIHGVNPKVAIVDVPKMEKGAMQRLAPYKPSIMEPHRLSGKIEHIANWQEGDPAGGRNNREMIPRIEGNERTRALHRLSGKTKVRKAPDGKREFLLHRGMGDPEHKASKGGVEHSTKTSWTPDHKLAHDWFGPGVGLHHKVASAWVHEDKVHHVPKQIGSPRVIGARNLFENEHEVIVDANHNSKPAEAHEVPKESHSLRMRLALRRLKGAVSKIAMTLKKEMYPGASQGKTKTSFHGWISSEGKFHRMEEDQVHTNVAYNHMVRHHPKEVGEGDPPAQLYNKGWISIGHAGNANAQGHTKTLSNPNHPATKKLAEMVRTRLHPDWDKTEGEGGGYRQEHFYVHHMDSTENYNAHKIGRKQAERGNFVEPKHKSLVAEFHKHVFSGESGALHGWISPEGKYHHMAGKDDSHVQWSIKHHTGGSFKGENWHEPYEQGWVSVGHGGGPTMMVHEKHWKDSNHPAMRTAKKLLAEKYPDKNAHIDILSGNAGDVQTSHKVSLEGGKWGKVERDYKHWETRSLGKTAGVPSKVVPTEVAGVREYLTGGKGDGHADKEFDQKELEMGTKVEAEHSNNPEIAAEIARDHLSEITDYYTRLKEMEEQSKKDGTFREVTKEGIGLRTKIEKQLEILKGAMQRLHPYKPQKEVDEHEAEPISHWIEGVPSEDEHEGGSRYHPQRINRESIPRLTGHGRARALHKLSAQTQVRRAADGKREFLLHRGMSEKEHQVTHKGTHVEHKETTSWTPHKGIARGFSTLYHKYPEAQMGTIASHLKPSGKAAVASAWIHEDNIHHVPSQLGKMPNPHRLEFDDEGVFKKPHGEAGYRAEHEVVVNPHKSEVHHEAKTTAPDIHNIVSENVLHGRPKHTEQTRALQNKFEHKPDPRQLNLFHSLKEKVSLLKGWLKKNDPIQAVFDIHGIQVNIEWPKGSTRQYKDGFKREMKAHYGYIANAPGDDGEELDVYVGDHVDSKRVFVVDQKDTQGGEEKVMLGYKTPEEAKMAHISHMKPENFGSMREITIENLKEMRKPKPGVAPTKQEDGVQHISKSATEGFVPKDKIFVSADGDNIGSTVEQRVLADDLEGIIKQSKTIEAGQAYLKNEFEKLGADTLVHGGDDNLFRLDGRHVPCLEEIRQGYHKATAFTITFGVGNTMKEAVQSLVYGKLTGKDRITYYFDGLVDRLSAIARKITPAEKYAEHGLLKIIDIYSQHLGDKEVWKSLKSRRSWGDVAKGAMQRLMPFNPKYVSNKEKIAVDRAQTVQTDDRPRTAMKVRKEVPEMDPNAKARALHRLHSKTEVRRSAKTGEREFLLHRGVSPTELKNLKTSEGRDKIFAGHNTSWTPRRSTAGNIAHNQVKSDLNYHVVSAWIPESKIHHIPKQIGAVGGIVAGFSSPKPGKNVFSHEHEVMVKPSLSADVHSVSSHHYKKSPFNAAK